MTWSSDKKGNYYTIVFPLGSGEPCETTLHCLTELGIGIKSGSCVRYSQVSTRFTTKLNSRSVYLSLFLSFLFTACCLAAQAMMQLKTPLKTTSGMFFPLSNIDDAENFNSLPCLCENRLIVFTLKTRRACRSSATIR